MAFARAKHLWVTHWVGAILTLYLDSKLSLSERSICIDIVKMKLKTFSSSTRGRDEISKHLWRCTWKSESSWMVEIWDAQVACKITKTRAVNSALVFCQITDKIWEILQPTTSRNIIFIRRENKVISWFITSFNFSNFQNRNLSIIITFYNIASHIYPSVIFKIFNIITFR